MLIHEKVFLFHKTYYFFSLIHVFSLSVEPKSSAVYWLFILALVFNLITAMTYPFFDLLPVLFTFNMLLYIWKEHCVLFQQMLLFITLCLIIRLKNFALFPAYPHMQFL